LQDQQLLKHLATTENAEDEVQGGEDDEAEEEEYEFKKLEDDIIKYLCEKIVAMRE